MIVTRDVVLRLVCNIRRVLCDKCAKFVEFFTHRRRCRRRCESFSIRSQHRIFYCTIYYYYYHWLMFIRTIRRAYTQCTCAQQHPRDIIYIITPGRLLLVRVPAGLLIFFPADRQSCTQYAAAVRVIIYHNAFPELRRRTVLLNTRLRRNSRPLSSSQRIHIYIYTYVIFTMCIRIYANV